MLKLDTIRKKEREENLQLKVQKIEQEAQQKKEYCSYLIVGTITAIGIVSFAWPKNKREK
jgi:hypothetical protein